MRLFRRGTVWYAQFYDVAGIRHQVSTRCHDKAAAELAARRFERDSQDPAGAQARSATLGGALVRLTKQRGEMARAGRRSHATVDFYGIKAESILRVLPEDFRLAAITPRVIDEYVSTRRNGYADVAPVKDSTIQKELVTMRAALKLAKRAGEWRGDLQELFPDRFSPEYKPKERWLSEVEVLALCWGLAPDRAARVAFIVATSACWSETDHAQRADVDTATSTVLIRGTKRATRWRTVPVVTPQQQALLRIAEEWGEGKDGALFRPWSNVRRDLHEACDAAGMARCSPNDLRRTCGTWLRAWGADPHLIAPVMGHIDSRMVERVYGRLDVEQLRTRLTAAVVDCSAGAAQKAVPVAAMAPVAHADAEPTEAPDAENTANHGPEMNEAALVEAASRLPGDGIEPPTRGFSIRAENPETQRKIGPKLTLVVDGEAPVKHRNRG